MSKPYRGQLRVSSYSAEATANPMYMAEKIPVIVQRLEQWNGKEWIIVCELRGESKA